jgi:hypothetical protein
MYLKTQNALYFGMEGVIYIQVNWVLAAYKKAL